ncbi:MAG: hypothetical protein PUI86_00865 [Bacteroidales bacterium]|nr:hypothetical protein [Bacteroidales bacterium]
MVIELCFGLCLAVLHSLFYPLLLSYRGSSCVDSSVDAVALHSVGFHPTFSRHGIAQSLSALALLIWLNEKVGLHPTFSRHGIAQSFSALALLIWLNEKVGFHPAFSRHGVAQSLSALALLIWLDEKVGFYSFYTISCQEECKKKRAETTK